VTEESTKKLEDTDLSAEVRIGLLSNASIKRYGCVNLFGEFWWICWGKDE